MVSSRKGPACGAPASSSQLPDLSTALALPPAEDFESPIHELRPYFTTVIFRVSDSTPTCRR